MDNNHMILANPTVDLPLSAKVSIKENYSTDDLFIDKAMDSSIEPYLKRFSSPARQPENVVIQLPASHGLPLLLAAWGSGLSVAILKESAHERHIREIEAALSPNYLRFALDEVGSSVTVHSLEGSVRLEDWFKEDEDEPALKVKEAPYLWEENECALILFTSGSSGAPKGVCHSLGNILRSAALFASHFELAGDDHLFCLAPVHTMSGFRSLLLPLVSSTRVTMPGSEESSFLSIIDKIKKGRATRVLCGPVFIKQLAVYGGRVSEAFSGVRSLFCTGAHLDETDRKSVEATLSTPVLNYYGLTETSGIVLAESEREKRPEALPPTCEGVKIVITQSIKKEGEFLMSVESENLFLGYLGESLERKSIFNTNDLVIVRADGTLKLAGRASGAIKAPSTEWIFPELLERFIRDHDNSIIDAVVKPSPVSGGYALEVWYDSRDALERVFFDSLDELITAELGEEHRPIRWKAASITRNSLGKVESIIEDEINKDDKVI